MKLLLTLLLLFTSNVYALTFDPTMKAGDITLSNSDQTMTGGSVISWAYLDVPLTVASGGKHYYEFVIDSGVSGQLYFGFEVKDTAPTIFTDGGWPFNFNDVTSNAVFTQRASGQYYSDWSGSTAGPLTWAAGDTVMVAFDLDTNKYYLGKNGTWDASRNPDSNNGYDISTGVATYSTLYPVISTDGHQITLSQSTAYTLPTGYTYLSAGPPPPPPAGTFTQFSGVNPPSASISSKGGLLTSDGTTQLEFPACADGEVIIWDSLEATGLKCGAN